MSSWVCLVLGGSLGTVLRYAAAGWLGQRVGAAFPFATLAVNMLGCFLIGILTVLLESKTAWNASAKLFLVAGFCGALTTFSTFIFEFHELIREGQTLRAFGYALISFILGFWIFRAGFWLGEKF